MFFIQWMCRWWNKDVNHAGPAFSWNTTPGSRSGAHPCLQSCPNLLLKLNATLQIDSSRATRQMLHFSLWSQYDRPIRSEAKIHSLWTDPLRRSVWPLSNLFDGCWREHSNTYPMTARRIDKTKKLNMTMSKWGRHTSALPLLAEAWFDYIKLVTWCAWWTN